MTLTPALPHRRAAGCALYFDYDSLARTLNRRRVFDVPISEIVAVARQEADLFGPVLLAQAFANWKYRDGAAAFKQLDIDPRYTSPGQRNARYDIGRDVAELAQQRPDIQTLVLVADLTGYSALLTTWRDQRFRLVVIDAAAERNAAANLAHRYLALGQQIALAAVQVSSSPPHHFALTSLIVSLDNRMAVRGERAASRDQCVEWLSGSGGLGPQAATWLAQAYGEGILIDHRTRAGGAADAVMLNERHPKVRHALDARDRLLLTIDGALRGRRWLAFNQLERVMRGSQVFGHSEAQRRRWIELLLADQLLLAEQRPHPQRPGQPPTTALAINRDHPVMQEIPQLVEHQLLRLVVLADCFLANRGYEWIAGSTLLRLLEGYLTPQAAQEVFSLAHDEQVILVERLEQPGESGQPVAAVRLNPSHQLVQSTLRQRDRAIRVIEAAMRGRRAHLGHTALVECLAGDGFSPSDAHRRLWLDLLIRAQVLRRSRGQQRGGAAYTLCRSLPVVAAALRQP